MPNKILAFATTLRSRILEDIRFVIGFLLMLNIYQCGRISKVEEQAEYGTDVALHSQYSAEQAEDAARRAKSDLDDLESKTDDLESRIEDLERAERYR